MNRTIEKFGYPATLAREFSHWLVLVRPAQVTLGSLVLAAKSDVTAYSDLPQAAFSELKVAISAIEPVLRDFTQYERVNYLMLMMVDPHVHFHVFPRYSQPRQWNGIEFADVGWPGQPRLDAAATLGPDHLADLAKELASQFERDAALSG